MVTTARDICKTALRRLRVIDADEAPDPNEAEDTLAGLNDMLTSWQQYNMNLLLARDFELDDEFRFFVPPAETGFEVIQIANLKGDWNADTNTPALSSGVGNPGDVYRVSVAGSTRLDDVSSWSVNDFLIYDGGLVARDVIQGGVWRRGPSSRRFNRGVHALLAIYVADQYGITPSDTTHLDAIEGWDSIMSAYIKPPTKGIYDSALVRLPSNRYLDYSRILGS
ncbi:MAG: hypothetical protein GDA50_04200 [Alphaproteobacteria bacterium GM202ARS2]|nr:hypothetical protein [Alphaproteobacteria bacterium GM202ARS2]